MQQQRPRWKKALANVDGIMGEGIGRLYVEKYFPESSKVYMEGLVENLRNALGKHIIRLPWMSDDTKVAAMKKLNAITVKIGYPDKWRDYSLLNVDPALSYYENMENAGEWALDRYLEKWGKPVDRSEWAMTPPRLSTLITAPSTTRSCSPPESFRLLSMTPLRAMLKTTVVSGW